MCTSPQLCSSLRLVLTLERATPSVSAISSACIGRSARKRRPWIWETVRFTPHLVPISPQCRMNFSEVGSRSMAFLVFVISVYTEHTVTPDGRQLRRQDL